MRSRLALVALLTPALALLLGFFLLPLYDLLWVSTLPAQAALQLAHPPHSLAMYVRIVHDPFYLAMTINSITVGLCTTLTVLLIGYPVAFYLTRATGYERTLISVACLLPIFVNLIVGILGWYILLLPFGVVQQVLAALATRGGQRLVTYLRLEEVKPPSGLPLVPTVPAAGRLSRPRRAQRQAVAANRSRSPDTST